MKSCFTLLIFGFFALVVSSNVAYPLACCAGGNAKSFVSVKSLQKYELGIATSFRDVYGVYNRDGDIEDFAKNQSVTLSLGLAARLARSLQGTFVIPFVYRYFESGSSNRSGATVGDALIGIQYTLVEPVFHDDWYPTVSAFGYLKFPSGSIAGKIKGVEIPGTGNGIWEPSVGVQLEKPIGTLTATLRASYTGRIARSETKEGDSFELMESLSLPIGKHFVVATGSSQTFYNERSINTVPIHGSGGKSISIFLTPTVFLTQLLSVSGGIEFSVPLHGWGRNQPASQLFSLAARYALF
jgi:hypothetical protein